MDNFLENRLVKVGQLLKILKGLGLLQNNRDEEWVLRILQQEETKKTEKSAHYRDE